jgi:hypothetical protein
MAKPPFDLKKGHRWFAVELNNLAWDCIEADTRTDEQLQVMIHAAHGACFHWLQVGDVLNHLRAQNLLAVAYYTAGLPGPAVRHAEQCLQLSAQAGDSQTAFDLACVHGCAALAYRQAGDSQRAKEQRNALERAITNLEVEDDIKVVERLYRSPCRHATGAEDPVFRKEQGQPMGIRKQIVDALQILAHADQQLSYERSLASTGHVPSELVCIFVNDLYHPKDSHFLASFTADELKQLAHLYGLIVDASRTSFAMVADMLKDRHWRRVMEVAKQMTVTFDAA